MDLALAEAETAGLAGEVPIGAVVVSAIGEVLRSQAVWSFLRAAMRIKYDIDIGPPRPPLGMLDKPWKSSDVERIVAAVDDK